MNFELDTTQCLLRDTLDSFLAKQYRFDARRKAVLGEPGWQPLLWRRFANELGLLGAGLPEQVGGSGGGAVEQMLVMEAVGQALVVEPCRERRVLGAAVLARRHGHAGGRNHVAIAPSP